jgi:LmbE family N-acetylglucosaminyl deacetylase/SAM-dependent methyltransferase
MVTFTHNDAGTSEAEWDASGVRALPELPLGDDELATMTFLVLAAHPDDESLGAGGLLARLHTLGATVRLLLCTAGEASHPQSKTTTPEQLAAVRLTEFGQAVSGLAPGAEWRFVKVPDGRLASHTDTIEAAIRQEIAGSGVPGDKVVIVAPYRADGHTDHDALGTTAARLAESEGYGLLEYPIWYWLWAGPGDGTWESWVRVPLGPEEQRAKAQAMESHASQIQPLSREPGDETLLSPTFLEHFSRSWETFAWTPPAGGSNNASDAETIFDTVHAREEDPWNYASGWYERRKRALALAALPEEHYQYGLEIGCSIGVLSAELARRCERFLAVDASTTALAQATRRLSGLDHARTEHLTVPLEWPSGAFDLVVVSEVGYYLSAGELEVTLHRIRESMRPGGTLLLCHWRHPISGWALDGETVHRTARRVLDWPGRGLYREKDFLLEVLVAPESAAGDGGPAAPADWA